MYLTSSLATVMLAGLLCPIAPANDEVPSHVPGIQIIADYRVPVAAQSDENENVGGADIASTVWYHSLNQPMVFTDVAYHRHYRRHYVHRRYYVRRHHSHRTAKIVGGSALGGAAIGALAGGGKGAAIGGIAGAGAGYLYDRHTRK